MKYTGPIYRPPFEAHSLLLQVTVGCSHNRCSFCTMYEKTKFHVETLEQIEKDLLEARDTYPLIKRIFLLNGDPFVLKASLLKEIAQKINEIIPEVETITMYASIKNIAQKTDEELSELRALKINELNIGIESGLDDVLSNLNKDFSLAEAETQLERLKKAGIDFSANIIIGAAGRERYLENARASAQLLNRAKPYLIFIATLHVDPGSPLETKMKNGQFHENSLRENLLEEIELVKNLQLENTLFFGLHPSNVVPLYGKLTANKQKSMLNKLTEGLASMDKKFLDSHFIKDKEGRIIETKN